MDTALTNTDAPHGASVEGSRTRAAGRVPPRAAAHHRPDKAGSDELMVFYGVKKWLETLEIRILDFGKCVFGAGIWRCCALLDRLATRSWRLGGGIAE
jgi:hypothetical protein